MRSGGGCGELLQLWWEERGGGGFKPGSPLELRALDPLPLRHDLPTTTSLTVGGDVQIFRII